LPVKRPEGVELTPIQDQLPEPAEELEVGFTHSVLAQCAMPRSKVEGDTFERRNGSVSLLMTAGKLSVAGEWRKFPLPHGTRPRLALLHLSAEAMKKRSPVVEVGRSARDFLKRLGLDPGGREHGTLRAQMSALAACNMRLGMGSRTIMDAAPIAAFQLHGEEGAAFWPEEARLGDRFFASLQEAAVPLNMHAIASLKNSALALDVYTWLTHRLCRVSRSTGELVSWKLLQEQFGGYGTVKDFRKEAVKALAQVRAVYPGMRVEEVTGCLRLLPSPSPVPPRMVTGAILPGSGKAGG
jgi:hypothetical protein